MNQEDRSREGMKPLPSGRGEVTRRTRRWPPRVAATLAGVAVALAAGCTPQPAGDGLAERQEAVAERGASVMPFDLERTTHHFTPTDTGGVQGVVADQPEDTEQIDLIREHLEEEAEAFGRGDFGDPARIHGSEMPGLAEGQAKAA